MPVDPGLDPFGPDQRREEGEGVRQESNGSSDDDDLYRVEIPMTFLDDDPSVATDSDRPLVFYELDCRSCVMRVRVVMGAIEVTY